MLIFIAFVGLSFAVRKLWPSRTQARLSVRWVALPFVAVILQAMLGIGTVHRLVGSGRFAVVVASYVVVGAWLAGNAVNQARLLKAPALIVFFGWLANITAIVLNHGMPVSRSALARIGVKHANMTQGNLYKHVLSNQHTIAGWLGDAIPIPIPIFKNVISIGDIAMFVGVLIGMRFVDFRATVKDKQKIVTTVPSEMALRTPHSS